MIMKERRAHESQPLNENEQYNRVTRAVENAMGGRQLSKTIVFAFYTARVCGKLLLRSTQKVAS